MKTPKKIKKLERKLISTAKKVDKYEQNLNFSRKFFYEHKKMQLDLNFEINRLLVPILEEQNPEFNKIARENYLLLINDNFQFKTAKTGRSLFGSLAAHYYGRLRENGHIYCQAKRTNIPLPFSKYEYPKRFVGTIDCIGNVRIKLVSSGHALVKRVPKSFESFITKNGKIEIFSTEREHDLISQGVHIAAEIIGNPFVDKPKEYEQFFENRKKLVILLDEFRIANGIEIMRRNDEKG